MAYLIACLVYHYRLIYTDHFYIFSCRPRLIDSPSMNNGAGGGKHRTLFYKGDDLSGTRTPSVWMLPHTNKLAIRVTTASSLDVGHDTTREIPHNQWTMLTFTFHNHTAVTQPPPSPLASSMHVHNDSNDDFTLHNSDPSDLLPPTPHEQPSNSDIKYSIGVYVNGERDILLSFGEPVLGNEADLSLFRDITHLGKRYIYMPQIIDVRATFVGVRLLLIDIFI